MKSTIVSGRGRKYLVAPLISLALVAAACGGSDDSSPTSTADSGTTAAENTSAATTAAGDTSTTAAMTDDSEAPATGDVEDPDITVGMLPIADYSAVIWAKDKGYFEEEGLNVELETLQGGPVGIQRVVSGDLDFSFTNLISFTIAVQGGAPIKVAALTSSLGAGAGGIFVPEDSDIKTLADLDGRTVGVNTTSNVGDVTINAYLKAENIDATPVYVEVPFPEMVAGIEAGSIDAGYTTEPFTSLAKKAGLRNLVDLYSGPNAELPMAIFATSDDYFAKNPNTVAAFTRATNKASAEMAANPDEFREFLPGATNTDPAVAADLSLPVFEDTLDAAKMQRTADVVFDQGLVPEMVDMQAYTAN